jgi:hypothetical protein
MSTEGKVIRALIERDIKTRKIEDDVNEELNAIERYEKVRSREKIET